MKGIIMSVPEIRRQKVSVTGLSTQEIRRQYGIKPGRAARASKVGYFIKNYMTPEIIIDASNFNGAYAYNVAGKVFWKTFARYDGALDLMPDMIQEAVKRMYELSGKLEEMAARGKYNKNYHLYYIAHNAMLSFYKAYGKTNRVVEKCRAVLSQHAVFQQKFMSDNVDDIDLSSLSYVMD
jgi:hypothetical protein